MCGPIFIYVIQREELNMSLPTTRARLSVMSENVLTPLALVLQSPSLGYVFMFAIPERSFAYARTTQLPAFGQWVLSAWAHPNLLPRAIEMQRRFRYGV